MHTKSIPAVLVTLEEMYANNLTWGIFKIITDTRTKIKKRLPPG
jgi:hypothetical protein